MRPYTRKRKPYRGQTHAFKPAKRQVPVLQEEKAKTFGLLHASTKHLSRLSKDWTSERQKAAQQELRRRSERRASRKIRQVDKTEWEIREAEARLRGDPGVVVEVRTRCPKCNTELSVAPVPNQPAGKPRFIRQAAFEVELLRVNDDSAGFPEVDAFHACQHYALGLRWVPRR